MEYSAKEDSLRDCQDIRKTPGDDASIEAQAAEVEDETEGGGEEKVEDAESGGTKLASGNMGKRSRGIRKNGFRQDGQVSRKNLTQ